jgi:hypothetical protein
MSDDPDLRLARIEAKLDVVVSQHSTAEKRLDDHEQRLRATERWQYAFPVATILAVIFR